METKLDYRQEGDQLVPTLTMETTTPTIGKYGQMRREYLKEHRRGSYSALLSSGTLMEHLREIDQRARELVVDLMTAMMLEANVTEALKATDPMEWVGLMNNFRVTAEETVLAELIYS